MCVCVCVCVCVVVCAIAKERETYREVEIHRERQRERERERERERGRGDGWTEGGGRRQGGEGCRGKGHTDRQIYSQTNTDILTDREKERRGRDGERRVEIDVML